VFVAFLSSIQSARALLYIHRWPSRLCHVLHIIS